MTQTMTQTILLQISFFVFGLAIGSFLNVVIFRFPALKSVITDHSRCPHCKKKIAAFDLIPVISYVVLLGRCRNCGKKISAQYPLVELATGLLFWLLFRHFGLSYILIPYLIIVGFSILVFVYDLKYLEIPEIFSWSLLIFAVIAALLSKDFTISNFLLGGLAGGGILGILVGISNERWMGSGDIKIGLAFGFLFGLYGALFFLFLAFIIGAIFGLILIGLKKKRSDSVIAFSPFLIISAIITIFFGQYLINLYLNLLGLV